MQCATVCDMNVPTNEELEANAPDTLREAVRGWLRRHVSPPYKQAVSWDEWLDWAADNFLADPEIRGAHKKEFGSA